MSAQLWSPPAATAGVVMPSRAPEPTCVVVLRCRVGRESLTPAVDLTVLQVLHGVVLATGAAMCIAVFRPSTRTASLDSRPVPLAPLPNWPRPLSPRQAVHRRRCRAGRRCVALSGADVRCGRTRLGGEKECTATVRLARLSIASDCGGWRRTSVMGQTVARSERDAAQAQHRQIGLRSRFTRRWRFARTHQVTTCLRR